ncbi:MAG: hypothetical protein V2J26_11395 [Pacificimonas sp.]|jgi:hypothetical protein|nr:hypothetical protein [Pacificimonas sp.]
MRHTLLAIAAVSVAALNVGLAVGPAHAETLEACDYMPEDIRNAALTADAGDARKALRKVNIGIALCEAGNERAAEKQFARALRHLDMTETELAQLNR